MFAIMPRSAASFCKLPVLSLSMVCVASSDDFTSSLNITGSSTYDEDLKYSSASMRCASNDQNGANLPVLLHQSLKPHVQTFSGVDAHFSQDVSAMITLNFSTGNVVVDGLVSTACNSSFYLLDLASNSTSNSTGSNALVLQHSSFGLAQQSALSIANYSSASIVSTHFSQSNATWPVVYVNKVELLQMNSSTFTNVADPEGAPEPEPEAEPEAEPEFSPRSPAVQINNTSVEVDNCLFKYHRQCHTD